MKSIKKNKPRCEYVYFCSLKDDSASEIERCRCVLPRGHLVGEGKKPWRHEHVTIEIVTFDQNCHELVADIKQVWAENHTNLSETK